MVYNVPHVTLDVAVETAIAYIESGIIPFFVSAPGVGKTASARRIAAALNAELRPIRLNNIAPEAASGLQYIDREGEKSIYLPPHWVPKADGSEGPVLIFMDELTQAPDENRKAIMSALLERYLGDVQLPDNCYFMAAGNSADDGTNVHEFDRATADRFGVIRVKTDVISWCNDYAPEKQIDIGLVAFLRIRPDCFEMSEEAMKGDNVVAPSPRTWEALDAFIKTSRKRDISEAAFDAGIKGKLGIEVGSAFMAVYDQVLKLKSIEDLLKMPEKEREKHAPETLEALWTYCQGMIWYATTEDKVQQVFELLDFFKNVKDVPFVEMRAAIAETIITRAVHDHDIRQIFTNEFVRGKLVEWKRENEILSDENLRQASNEDVLADDKNLDALQIAA